MNRFRLFILVSLMVVFTDNLYSQSVELKASNLEPVNVFMTLQTLNGEDVVRVVKDSVVEEFDEPTFVKIKELNFTNGTIEVKVLSRLLPNAPDLSRGFIGLAFRIDSDNSQFESIYLRPTNSRADNQLRRNHAIQYFAYPSYKYQRLRKESPEMYESYADFALNQWIAMRIEVSGDKAKLYINENEQPSLIVNDLKLGENGGGAIGMFVDVGTEGFFKDLKVSLR